MKKPHRNSIYRYYSVKGFCFLLVAGLSPKLTNEPTNDQDRIYTVLLRTACYALTEWFYAA